MELHRVLGMELHQVLGMEVHCHPAPRECASCVQGSLIAWDACWQGSLVTSLQGC